MRSQEGEGFRKEGDGGEGEKKTKRTQKKFKLEGREPPLTLRKENHYLYFGRFFPCTPGPFAL